MSDAEPRGYKTWGWRSNGPVPVGVEEQLAEALTAMQALKEPQFVNGRATPEWKAYDYEIAHSQADDILVVVLRLLGEDELADAFDKVGKWYS